MKKIILPLLAFLTFSTASFAGDLSIKGIYLNKSGKPGLSKWVDFGIFDSKAECTKTSSVKKKECGPIDGCGTRYWITIPLAGSITRWLGPTGKGIQIFRNGRSQCVMGNR